MFRDEMSSQAKPSLDGMAGEVLAKGGRARQARRTEVASTALLSVGLVGAGIAVPTLSGGGHPAAAVGDAAAKSAASTRSGTQTAPVGGAKTVPATTILTSVTSSADYIPQPAGGKAPTASAAVLAELLKLLPPGKTSGYASFGLGAQVDYDGPSGLGMIRLSLYRGSLNPDACSSAGPCGHDADLQRAAGRGPAC
jgi:hypothetical protein